MFNLKGRNFLTLMDFNKEEINYFLNLAYDLKRAKYAGIEHKTLEGKNIALIFEKTSTRTRCSFEVAAHDQGAHVTYLDSFGSQIGSKESIKDTARVLGRMFDGIEYRGYGQNIVETLAKYSGVPVWNGLTDIDHPTQILADFLTIREHFTKELSEIKIAYLGDGRNNMANALMIGCSKMGADFRIVAPRQLFPDEDLVKKCKKEAELSSGKITITDDIDEGVNGVDILYTDVWVSMGEPKDTWEDRIKLLLPYQINMDIIKRTKNKDVKFLHCLPAYHDYETAVGKEIGEKFNLPALEVTDEVFESKYSLVFDEAENRMHTIKAVMVATLGK